MEYTIKKGDTLSAIAKANNTSVSELAKINNIANPDLIYAGATLVIPDSTSSSASRTSSSVAGNSGSSGNSTSGVTSYTDPSYSATKPTYSVGSDVKEAQTALNNWENSKPAEYESAYSGNISEVLDKILNRESFSYDFNADPVYKYYREQYLNDGKLAMKDTLGSASALTGGYANSYAANAANAAYNEHLGKLTDIIPSLMEAAYMRYSDSLENERKNLETLLGLDKTDYSRYRDTVSDYRDEGDYLYKKFSDLSDDDYARFLEELEQWNSDREYDRKVYEDERDAAYQRERDAVEDSQWEKELALSQAKLAASVASSASNKSTSTTTTTTKKSTSNDEFSYKDCGSRARELIDMLMSPESYDKAGNLRVELIDYLNAAKKSGEITSDEYKYIIGRIN